MKDSYPEESELVCCNDSVDIETVLFDMCALANNKGGIIYCGVNSKGKTIGLEPESFLAKLQSMLVSMIAPNISYAHEIIVVGHKYMIEITIQSSTKLIKFERTNKQFDIYFRLDSNTILASKIIIAYISLKKGVAKSLTKEDELKQNDIQEIIIDHQPITLSQIYSKSLLTKSEIDKLLPNLLCLERISMKYLNDKIKFIS